MPVLLKRVPLPLDRSTTGAAVLAEISLPVLVVLDAVPATSAEPPEAPVTFTVAAVVTTPAVSAWMPVAPAPFALIA